jgi:predicted XRE-type DNA-binding protein
MSTAFDDAADRSPRRARSWVEVRADGDRISGSTPERRATARQATEDHVRAWALRQVRENRHITQAELATTLGIGQPRVSRLERGDLATAEVATLRAYVEALGGRLRITAEFDDQQLTLG